MTDRETRTLPSFVWVAVIASVTLHFVSAVLTVSKVEYQWLGIRTMLASSATAIAWTVVLVIAIAHLGRRLIGVAAIGARIAMWALVVSLAVLVFREVYSAMDKLDRDVDQIYWYGRWAVGLVATTGLIIAASGSRALMIAGGALALLQELPPIAWQKLSSVIGTDYVWFRFLSMIMVVVGSIGWVLLLYGATRGTETPLPSLAIRGLRLAARGVWLRVIAAITSVCVTFMMFAASHGSGKAIEVALVAALVVNMLSFAMFGIGAIQVACSNLDGVPRFALGAAGVLSLWCGALMLMQIPWLYAVMTDSQSFGGIDFLDALSIAQPIVATLSAALLTGGIAAFATARGDSGGLGRQARSAGVAFVCLMLFSLFAQYGLSRGTSSDAGGAMVMLLAAVCALIAQVALAQLCSAASNAIDSEPSIPTATLQP